MKPKKQFFLEGVSSTLKHLINHSGVLFFCFHLIKTICLKAHRQISKKWCFEKYCSCDKACQFSAL